MNINQVIDYEACPVTHCMGVIEGESLFPIIESMKAWEEKNTQAQATR